MANLGDSTETRLYMEYALSSGKTKTYALLDPKPNLTEATVKTALNQAVTGDLIRVGEAQAVSLQGAYYRTITKQDIVTN